MQPLLLPGGFLVAPPAYAPNTSLQSRKAVFVAESGSSAGKSASKKLTAPSKGKPPKPPAFGGKMSNLLSAAKVPSDVSAKITMSSKELRQQAGGAVITGDNKASLSLKPNGLDFGVRWGSLGSRRSKPAFATTWKEAADFEASVDAGSAASGTTFRSGLFTWSPRLWGKRDVSLLDPISASASTSLETRGIKLPHIALLAWLPSPAAEPAVAIQAEASSTLSTASAQLSSSLRGYAGHGLHYGISGSLRSGKQAPAPSPDSAPTAKSGPQRYSAEARMMYAGPMVEVLAKASLTPKLLEGAVSACSSTPLFAAAGRSLDLGMQSTYPLKRFGAQGSRGGTGGQATSTKVAARLHLDKHETLSAMLGLNDAKLGLAYKWEGSVGALQPSARHVPLPTAPVAPTPVNVFGPVGAEGYTDAMAALCSRDYFLSISTFQQNSGSKPDSGKAPANNVTFGLGAELDPRGPALVHHYGCTVALKL